jgi:hypothetical protein
MTVVPAATATEADCQATIIEAARTLGYRVHHTRAARSRRGWRTPVQGDAGFPDLVLAGHGHLLVVELKRRGNRPTAQQQAWLDTLTDAGIDARLLTVPDDQQGFVEELTAHAARRRAHTDQIGGP